MLLRSLLLGTLLVLACALQAKERVTGMNQKVYEKLSSAQELIEKKEFDQAQILLAALLERKRISSYEHAHVLNMMGAIYQQNETYPKAIEAYQKALALDGLPLSLRQSLLTRLTQLHMVIEKYDLARKYAKDIIALSEEPNATANILAAQASYFLDDLEVAKQFIETALLIDKGPDKAPRESWMLIANAIYYGLKDYDRMIEFQFELLAHYPRDRYLLNLAGIFGEMENPEKQLALVEAVYEGGYLRDSNKLASLASLLMYNENPYKSAVILSEALNSGQLEKTERNYENLAQAWVLSGELEKAIAPMLEAAKLSTDGNTYTRVASIYIGLAQWEEVVEFLNSGLQKGGLLNEANTYLSRGMAQFKLKRYTAAKKSFEYAERDPNTEKLARQWLSYMKSEQEKLRSLKES